MEGTLAVAGVAAAITSKTSLYGLLIFFILNYKAEIYKKLLINSYHEKTI